MCDLPSGADGGDPDPLVGRSGGGGRAPAPQVEEHLDISYVKINTVTEADLFMKWVLGSVHRNWVTSELVTDFIQGKVSKI